MEYTCCGKKCFSCRDRAALKCPGCTKGPGRGFRGKYACPVVQCCHDSGRTSCLRCTEQVGCQKKTEAEELLRQRLRKQQRIKSEMIRTDRPLAPRLVILCVLGVVMRIINWVAGGESADDSAMSVLIIILQLLAGLTLLSAGPINSHFYMAGIFFLISPIIESAVSLLVSDLPFSIMLLLIEMVSSLVYIYQISMGCAEVLDPYANSKADRWRGYWIIYCLALLLSFIFLFFSQTDYRFLSRASMLLTTVCALAVFILDIVRFVMYISAASTLWSQKDPLA